MIFCSHIEIVSWLFHNFVFFCKSIFTFNNNNFAIDFPNEKHSFLLHKLSIVGHQFNRRSVMVWRFAFG